MKNPQPENLVPYRLDEKTVVFAKPGTDIEKLRKKLFEKKKATGWGRYAYQTQN